MVRDRNGSNEILKSLIGKTLEEGRTICENNGYTYRIIRRDETNYITTSDLRFDRINFQLDSNIITKCSIS